MTLAGIDIGSRYIKYAFLENGEPLALVRRETGYDPLPICRALMEEMRADRVRGVEGNQPHHKGRQERGHRNGVAPLNRNQGNLIGKRVGIRDDVVFAGGCAKNPCVTRLLAQRLNKPVLTHQMPDMLSAFGAAMCAGDA